MTAMTPNWDLQYKYQNLLDGTTINMNVDGSETSKKYRYDIPAGEFWYLRSITVFLMDGGVMDHTVFGALATALTNGLSLKVKKNGADLTIKDIKNNTDLLMVFNERKMIGSSDTSFLDQDDYFSGTLVFDKEIKLIGDKGDDLKMVVKDDLTTINTLRASALLWRPI